MHFFRYFTLIGLMLCLPLTGCLESKSEVEPEDAALRFFDAIYNKKDVKIARALVDKDLAELFDHYRTISNIQRHVIGMTLPGRPEINVEVRNTSTDFFRKFEKKNVVVEVHFSSKVDDRFYYDTRTIKLRRNRDKTWTVIEINDDPFATNG